MPSKSFAVMQKVFIGLHFDNMGENIVQKSSKSNLFLISIFFFFAGVKVRKFLFTNIKSAQNLDNQKRCDSSGYFLSLTGDILLTEM